MSRGGRNDGRQRRFSARAMACRFEIVFAACDHHYANQLARTAFHELQRLEADLSRHKPTGDIWRINSLGTGEGVLVDVCTHECLRIAENVWRRTGGAFDVTAPAAGDGPTGMDKLEVHSESNAVAVRERGLSLDLGGIGKGYALDVMARILQDWEAGPILLLAVESTALAAGPVADAPWLLGLRRPDGPGSLAEVRLEQAALSGSGVSLHGAHIIDPRSGEPASRAAAWAVAPTAAEADALSTAFMVMGQSEVERFCEENPRVGAALLEQKEGAPAVYGNWP